MENTKTLSKKEIALLLGKSYGTVKNWSEEKLAEQLLNNCYEILHIEKVGRKIEYTLQYKETGIGDNIILWLTKEYGIRKGREFKGYLDVRMVLSDKGECNMSKKIIAEQVGVSSKSVASWDELLKSLDILSDDGYTYIKATGFAGTYKEEVVSKEEYSNWWGQHKVYERALALLDDHKELKPKEKVYFRENLRMGTNVFYYRIRKLLFNKSHPFYHALKRNLGYEDYE